MAETLTDVDTFNASIQMPTSGENVSAADLRDKAIQRLSNRTYSNKLRLDKVQEYAGLGITTGAASDASSIDFSSISYQYGSGFSLSSGALVVPAVGFYEISGQLRVTHSATTDPLEIPIEVKLGGTHVSSFRGVRYSGNTAHITILTLPPHVREVTDVADTFTIYNDSGNTVTLSAASFANYFTIRQLS